MQFAAVDCKTHRRRMNVEEVYSRLCRLIGDCLLPYGELVDISFTPEIEKGLLISLSQVFRKIKLWILELDSDLDNVSEEECKEVASGSCVPSGSHPHEHQCMAKIVVHLVSLISLQKPLIQHLTENILVAISEFSSISGTGWEEYIQLLCRWLKFSLQKSLSCSVVHLVFEGIDSDFDSLISVWPLKLSSENLNYVVVSSILRVLRNVLKLLKLNMNDKLLEVYLELVTDTFSNMGWDLFHEFHVVSNFEAPAGSAGHISLQQHAIQSKSIALFHANLVQLCCSLIDVNGVAEAGGNTDVHHVISQIRGLIPKIVAACIGKRENLNDARIFHYLRHKILMLLMRLGLKVHLEHSDLILWLHTIDKYFHDLLLQPLKRVNESNQEDCLEGSPFWEDDFGAERQRISSHHLQRLVVFLLLRCSLILENSKEKADEGFTLVTSVPHTAFDLYLQSDCSSRSKGVSVLQKWLMRHLPTNIFVDHEMYPQKCTGFALSFLKLYMHEDDILFEMLLQLLCVPCNCTWIEWGETSSTTTNDFLCLISDIFNPIHLFHLFLAEIHYDHQVLLDYLISKDTGAKSAEYLLRCLRVVCNSWKLFVKFSSEEKSPNPSCQKRRKVLRNFMELHDGFNSTLMEDDLNSSTLGTDCKTGYLCDGKNERVQRFSFEDAKGCLLSLKTSISNLYQKNLFPYNPQVLLRRLSRFQELCLKETEEQTAF